MNGAQMVVEDAASFLSVLQTLGASTKKAGPR